MSFAPEAALIPIDVKNAVFHIFRLVHAKSVPSEQIQRG
jgi:hypothetical protein